MPPDRYGFVSVPNVRAVSGGNPVLICDLGDGRRVGVPTDGIAPGSEVQKPGDYGTLVLSHECAERLGLVSPGK
jgi:hypothetical protein